MKKLYLFIFLLSSFFSSPVFAVYDCNLAAAGYATNPAYSAWRAGSAIGVCSIPGTTACADYTGQYNLTPAPFGSCGNCRVAVACWGTSPTADAAAAASLAAGGSAVAQLAASNAADVALNTAGATDAQALLAGRAASEAIMSGYDVTSAASAGVTAVSLSKGGFSDQDSLNYAHTFAGYQYMSTVSSWTNYAVFGAASVVLGTAAILAMPAGAAVVGSLSMAALYAAMFAVSSAPSMTTNQKNAATQAATLSVSLTPTQLQSVTEATAVGTPAAATPAQQTAAAKAAVDAVMTIPQSSWEVQSPLTLNGDGIVNSVAAWTPLQPTSSNAAVAAAAAAAAAIGAGYGYVAAAAAGHAAAQAIAGGASPAIAAQAGSLAATGSLNSAGGVGNPTVVTGSVNVQFPGDYSRSGEAAAAAAGLGTKLDTLHGDFTGQTTVADPAALTAADMPGMGSTFDSIKSWTLPAHTSTCPQPQIDLSGVLGAGRIFTLSTHCQLAQDHFPVLQAAMMLVWSVSAMFVVLKA